MMNQKGHEKRVKNILLLFISFPTGIPNFNSKNSFFPLLYF